MMSPLFEGLEKLTETLGERHKAINTYNDYSISYYVRRGPKVDSNQLNSIFNRWVDVYKEQIRSKYDER